MTTVNSSSPRPDPTSANDIATRWRQAAREDLTQEEIEELILDGSEPVLSTLAQNASLPPETLERLAREGDHLRNIVILNAAAPPHLKDIAQVWQHTQLSIKRYLDEREATPDEASELFRLLDEHSADPLGVAWRRIRPES